jgi:hypothetical protein
MNKELFQHALWVVLLFAGLKVGQDITAKYLQGALAPSANL